MVPTRKRSERTGNRQEHVLGFQTRVTKGVMETLDRCGGPVGEVGRSDKEVEVRRQWRCVCVCGGGGGGGVGASDEDVHGEDKNGGLLVNKQGQRRDVRAQRRDVPEGGVANVATLGSNVATLGSNVATFQRG